MVPRPTASAGRWRHRAANLVPLAFAIALVATGCGVASSAASVPAGVVRAIGVENEYANVIAQIGGPYVHVTSILDNPNTDPHTYEASPSVARQVSGAQLIVQNGAGYDAFINAMESASPNSGRKVIVAQHLLHLPDRTPNPHLWYAPGTMPAVAAAIAAGLSALQPRHAAVFAANARNFDTSLQPWWRAIAAFKARYGGSGVAATEPVADYLLDAMGTVNLTPYRFQAAIMNGTDPSPRDISLERGLVAERHVRMLCYNAQVVDDLTASIRQSARSSGVPVVGVYETMPTGYDYQSWMLAETEAIQNAIAHGTSGGGL
jgi:zinc/manganese transport system substrate-binding protein